MQCKIGDWHHCDVMHAKLYPDINTAHCDGEVDKCVVLEDGIFWVRVHLPCWLSHAVHSKQQESFVYL